MVNSYNKEVIFHLPGIFEYAILYLRFLEEIFNNKYILKDNAKIGSIYGSPAGIWNGGRVVQSTERVDIEALQSIKNAMEFYQIPIRFTWSNCLIDETHLSDEYCNLLLELFDNGNNEIIINSSILESYIRSKYNNDYKYISSITKNIKSKDRQQEEINNDYHLIVLHYDFNTDYEYLKSLSNKDKCELLCNTVCKPNCPNRKKHFEGIARCQLEGRANDFQCPDMMTPFWQIKQNKNGNFISVEGINEIYIPMGFKNFKLEGRGIHPLELIEILIYYLIKDEYASEIRYKLQCMI